MQILLDSDVLSMIASGRAPARIAEEVSRVVGPIYTTTVNWAEVCYGMARSPAGERLREGYERYVLPAIEFLDFDRESAEVYGRLRAELEGRGTPLGEADLTIAAIALRHDLTLITGNVRHFQRVPGLRVEDWLR